METPAKLKIEDWVDGFFAAKAVQRGGVVRRSVAWVEHEIGRERFIAEVRDRGFALLEAGGQFIVICSRGPIRRLL
ncbi:MAG: N-(5'-phosphoribosyl)anthranilate isomerase [Pseudomonadota bacterium]